LQIIEIVLVVTAKTFITPTPHEDHPYLVSRIVRHSYRHSPNRVQFARATVRAVKADQPSYNGVLLKHHSVGSGKTVINSFVE
jgi:hypothetical protein